ncbi:MAG: 4-(cytidine 5'-diphospho)-2-C-methyl-D-erythritol kinase [Actinomycetota bacterium]
MKVQAPAKVNLFLSVGPRRGDGLHEISSVMQSVSLFDEVALTPADAFLLDVAPPGSAPEDETNLVVRAAQALWGALGRTPGTAVSLAKAIPVGAGLGGGSSDAAAALVGLNELWEGRLSRKALGRVGAAVGADVPFCVVGGTAAVRGAGEIVTPMPVRGPLWWVLAAPQERLSTAQVYAEFDRRAEAVTAEDPFGLADALARGDVQTIAAELRNDLTEAACALAPAVRAVLDALRSAGALGAVMSGSGSACAGVCEGQEHAREVAEAVRGSVSFVSVVMSLDRGPRIVQK